MSPTQPLPEPYAEGDDPPGDPQHKLEDGPGVDQVSGTAGTKGVPAQDRAGTAGGTGLPAHDSALSTEHRGDLSSETLLRRERPAPRRGWRRALFTVTKGRLNPGDSRTELRRRELESTIRNAALPGCHHSITVLGAQKNTGATTTTLGLGTILAAQRGDRVIAVDADPDGEPLNARLPVQAPAHRALHDLLAHPGSVLRYSEISRFVAQGVSGLDVLPSTSADTGGDIQGEDYHRLIDTVQRFYSLLLVDGGSSIERPAVPAILDRSDQLVLVSHPSREGANRAATALEEVVNLGYDRLASQALVILAQAPGGEQPDLDELQGQLAERCHRAFRVPRDTRLGSGGTVEPDRLRTRCLFGYLELAAEVTAGFGGRG